MRFQKPRLTFSNELPHPKVFGAAAILIYDRILSSHVEDFDGWVRKFPAAYGVRAGESLKDLAHYPKHMEKILSLADQFPPKEIVLVVVGGGSVGDFGGFTASILKRGVKLVQIPTTWLSAIDSAHGGKTALNVHGVKNQIGTFYPAGQIFLIRSVLFSQPSEQALDALGELFKIALIEGGKLWSALSSAPLHEGNLIWDLLPQAIAAKYKIVMKDPFETKGVRQVLNLGHTLGHVLEAYHGLSHGSAVAQGLLFCLEWSRKKGYLNRRTHTTTHSLLTEHFNITPLADLRGYHPIPTQEFRELLQADKKRHSASKVTFVFLRNIGKTALVHVPIDEIILEANAQGWSR